MFILKLSRLCLFLAQFTLKIQISRYIVNKLLFLIIFVEIFLTIFDIKNVKSTKKHVYIKIIKTPLISSLVYLKNKISRYIVNKLLFLIIFVERNFTNFLIQKRLNQPKKHVYIKIIKTPLIYSIVYFKNSNIKIYSK